MKTKRSTAAIGAEWAVVILLLLLLTITAFGCRKEDPAAPLPPPCDRDHTGTVHVINNVGSTWLLWVGSELVDTLPPYQETTWTLPTGTYTLHAAAGFVNASATANVEQCGTFTWNLP